MYHELYWSIWSLEQWIQFDLDLSDKSLDLTILFLVGWTESTLCFIAMHNSVQNISLQIFTVSHFR